MDDNYGVLLDSSNGKTVAFVAIFTKKCSLLTLHMVIFYVLTIVGGVGGYMKIFGSMYFVAWAAPACKGWTLAI